VVDTATRPVEPYLTRSGSRSSHGPGLRGPRGGSRGERARSARQPGVLAELAQCLRPLLAGLPTEQRRAVELVDLDEAAAGGRGPPRGDIAVLDEVAGAARAPAACRAARAVLRTHPRRRPRAADGLRPAYPLRVRTAVIQPAQEQGRRPAPDRARTQLHWRLTRRSDAVHIGWGERQRALHRRRVSDASCPDGGTQVREEDRELAGATTVQR
jgi:hypothetical protein